MLKLLFGDSSSNFDLFAVALAVWVYVEWGSYLYGFCTLAGGALISVIGSSILNAVNKNKRKEIEE